MNSNNATCQTLGFSAAQGIDIHAQTNRRTVSNRHVHFGQLVSLQNQLHVRLRHGPLRVRHRANGHVGIYILIKLFLGNTARL